MVRALLFLLAAGCVHTVTSTATPATAKIDCIDCKAPAAVGLPIRAVASWVGSCTKSGFISELREDKASGRFYFEKVPFSDRKECDEHRYKIDVECSTQCVVKSQASPESPNIRLVVIYPQQPGPLHYAIKIHREGEPPVAETAQDVVVRAPDGVSRDEKVRVFDSDTALAVFDGWTYQRKPPKRFELDFPLRGQRYTPPQLDEAVSPPPTQVTKLCFARAPGAADWNPCAAGIHEGDDLRVDILATIGAMPSDRDFALESTADGFKWTCYRSPILGPENKIEGITPVQTCVRYGVPATGLAVKYTSGTYATEETLGEPAAPQPAVAATGAASTVTLDSRKAFDSRRGRIGDVLGLFEGEYLGIRDLRIVSGFVVIAATVSPTWGRVRVGIGDGEFADTKDHPTNQKRLFRATLGWEKELCVADNHLCGGLAVDGGYSFYDPIEGFYAVPQAIVDVRGTGLLVRLGIGQTLVLGTFKDPGQKSVERGLTIRLSFGFPRDF